MSIYKKHRVFSEKLTSIEDPIAIVQRGVVTFGATSGQAFLIPTQIANPVNLKITPMCANTAQALTGGGGAASIARNWYSNLLLYHATNAASLAFGSCGSIASIVQIGNRIKMHDAKLYVTTASLGAGSCSTTGFVTALASGDRWRQLEEFGSNAQKYLVVNIPESASGYFGGKLQKLAYEVIGYEY